MISAVYNYYLSTYAGRQVTKYDTHKKDELKNNYCKDNKCLFIINDNEKDISITIQTNMEILDYVKKNYMGIYNSNLFSVYIN